MKGFIFYRIYCSVEVEVEVEEIALSSLNFPLFVRVISYSSVLTIL